MELTFPFKNLAFNNLIKLFEVGNIREYFEAEDKEEWMEESFNVRFYKDRIPSFENEILQIIETTNQETIDYYFNDLGENVERRAGSNLPAGRQVQSWAHNHFVKVVFFMPLTQY